MIEKKFTEQIDAISKYLNVVEKIEPIRKSGVVVSVVGNVIYSQGPPDSKVGEILEVERGSDKGYLPCVLVGFKDHLYTLMPLGDTQEIFPHAFVFSSGRQITLNVGPELLGRVLNGLGKPIDSKGILITKEERASEPRFLNPLDRPPITEILETGVRAIDGMLTVGRGQRIGIFSGSGVGKSSLLGMIARYTNADVNVVALIGERGREVNEFLHVELGKEALTKSVVFVATSDSSKMEQVSCANLACSAAEYFREKGMSVNLYMDSLTRYAEALRELSIGEPVVTKGYASSVFTKMAKLVERAGTSHNGGSITGFYTVLTDAEDDMDDIVADKVRGFIDGHIVLTRKLAEQSHYPAIDVPSSLSRLMQKIVNEDHYMRASIVRELISKYKNSEDIILLNAYVRGADEKIDMAIDKKSQIDDYLRQRIEEKSSYNEAIKRLEQILQSSSRNEDEF
ncbi:ATPase, FliI/YscN family [Leptospira yanagawae serovar Saopaulo str. Sao Paulo = ATCC 700523]|uniref:FliI/YscN family ATPase n=2 Tax=Leptospira yanagawae TaxID=293069 RepID=A0ABY2M990_9LEPT|nr:FliI/YscN family ATPase [Leptospira yanagawae]EOQ87828.1 ATPase, FliI/YscN family [Leptospira yanagawae serovar Saopaulo str. Sao Paulo = ATCC 700523]TGL25554.1 FliI/YscN family ATPase [Leptospira yanagawae]